MSIASESRHHNPRRRNPQNDNDSTLTNRPARVDRPTVVSMSDYRLVIVGAGLAGLTAALDVVRDPGWSGDRIAIVEQEHHVGGRLATEAVDGAVFDHGAQFFTVRSPAFSQQVEQWVEAGVVEEWCRGFGVVDGYPRYRVRGGMQHLATHLTDSLSRSGVEIITGATAAVSAGDGQWLVSTPGRELAAASILLTPPVPVARKLLRQGNVPLQPEVAAALDDFVCHRVLALLAHIDRPAPFDAPGALQQPDDPTFSFVADNQAKTISPQPCVTFHTAHARSAELWPLSDVEVVNTLRPDVEALVAPARVTDLQLRRWPCSGPVTPFPDPCLVVATEPGLLVLGGDGFGSSKVEGAFSSGLAAATTIRDRVA